MNKHTPGPWSKDKIKTLDVMVDASSPCPMINCIAATNWERATEWYANARLIAAAPELLEALRTVVFANRYGTKDNQLAAADFAAIVIAKAEGR